VATGILFPHARQALQITRKTRRLDSEKWTTEIAYAVTSLVAEQATAAELAAWVRGHWGIEVRLHWVRDVTFDEDRSQVRTGTGPRVMASLRNLVISMLRLDGVTNIAQALRHHARDPCRLPRNIVYGDGEPVEDEVITLIKRVYDEARLRFPGQREDVLIVDDPLGGDRRVPVAMSDLYTAEASC
jgi:predicted transposase YbfD/YdcC